MTDNRREYFRVYFDYFIIGNLSIEDSESIPIKIDNVSIGGMGFISSVDIPVEKKLKCSFTILDDSFCLDSVIVRKFNKINTIEYAVKFEMDQETSSKLFKQLNYYQISQRRGKK